MYFAFTKKKSHSFIEWPLLSDSSEDPCQWGLEYVNCIPCRGVRHPYCSKVTDESYVGDYNHLKCEKKWKQNSLQI